MAWLDSSLLYDLSNDAQSLVFVELSSGQGRNSAIYLRKADASPAIQLGYGNRPSLSPDGKWVACIHHEAERSTLMLLPTGAGESPPIPANGMHYGRAEWFPDGERLLFTGNEPGKPPRTFVQNRHGGKPVPITPEGMTGTRVSPDQQFVTVAKGGKLYLFPIAGGELRPIADLEQRETAIRWSTDGHFLFLSKLMGPSVLIINRLDVNTGRQEQWKELKTPDPVGVQIREAVITPDGKSYAYSYQRDISTLYLADGLR